MRKLIQYIIFSIVGLVVISLFVSLWLPITQAFRLVFGSIYILFLPGLVLSYVFFKKGEKDFIERIALSFALSIVIIPLLTFYFNLLFKVKINLLNVSLKVLAFTAVSSTILLWRARKSRK